MIKPLKSGSCIINNNSSAKAVATLLMALFSVSGFQSWAQNKDLIKDKLYKDTLTTHTGLKYLIIKRGDGQKPWRGNKVSIYFIMRNMKGKKLDSNTDAAPYKFKVGVKEVIDGLDEGIGLMTRGAVYKFIIPAKLAYGTQGLPNPEGSPKYLIPPNSDLIYEVELVDF